MIHATIIVIALYTQHIVTIKPVLHSTYRVTLFYLGEENVVTQADMDCLKSRIEDKTKLKYIALYIRERHYCQKLSGQSSQEGRWLDEWSKFYPNPTRTVLYQALIYVGEHAIARSLLPLHSQGECIVPS